MAQYSRQQIEDGLKEILFESKFGGILNDVEHTPNHGIGVNMLHELEQKQQEGQKQQQQQKAKKQQPQKGQPKDQQQQKEKDKLDRVAEQEAQLKKDHIFPLTKKSQLFPNAKYFCRICEFHLSTIAACRKHQKELLHRQFIKAEHDIEQLRHLSVPTATHCEAITELLKRVIAEQSPSSDQWSKRLAIVDRLQDIIKNKCPGVKLKLYGSSLSRLALKDSDVNIDVSTCESPVVLKTVCELLLADDSGYLSRFEQNFCSKLPSATFYADGLRCRLAVCSADACKLSELIACYAAIDERFGQLATVFRYWAKLCEVDHQEEGTLPACAFHILTIYFLQQCRQPVLPVLHELQKNAEEQANKDAYCSDVDKLSNLWVGENTANIGSLWLDMLRFYSIECRVGSTVVCIRQKAPLSYLDKHWSSKRMAIEDPFVHKHNMACSLNSSQALLYFLERLRAACLYFCSRHQSTNSDGSDPCESKNCARNACGLNSSVSDICQSGEIDDVDDGCQSNSSASGIYQSESSSMCQTASSASVSRSEAEAYGDVMVRKLLADVMTQLSTTHLASSDDACVSECVADDSVTDDVTVSTTTDEDSAGSRDDEDGYDSKLCNGTNDAVVDINDVKIGNFKHADVVAKDDKLVTRVDIDGIDDTGESKLTTSDRLDAVESDGGSFVFEFSETILRGNKRPPLVCCLCQKEGHLKANCPDERLPTLKPLPPLTPKFKHALQNILLNIPMVYGPTRHDVQIRNSIVADLQRHIRQMCPDAELTLFGSSCNGFGFRHSDLDICMTLKGSSGKNIDCVEMIQKLARKLRQHRDLYAIFTVTTAKVPIVKFCHRVGQLEIDICLYNQLALRNTEMMKLYSEIDARAQVLGYVMKLFAKMCDIGDASRGSLSSYAYILMVIYFLQQRQPPVLPVLQQIGRGNNAEDVVDGWNAWFFKDIEQLGRHWPEMDENEESVADLWVGMLRFYTEQFNFREHVVCIRQREPLTRFEKLWNGNTIAIEDPFNLGHNLGAGISVKMNTYIMKALCRGRTLFGTPVQKVPKDYPSLQSYLFSFDELVDGERPMDKCCRCCGKIGHKAKECHIIVQRKKYQQQARAKNNNQKAKDTQQLPVAEKEGPKEAVTQNTKTAKAVHPDRQPAGNADQVVGPQKQRQLLQNKQQPGQMQQQSTQVQQVQKQSEKQQKTNKQQKQQERKQQQQPLLQSQQQPQPQPQQPQSQPQQQQPQPQKQQSQPQKQQSQPQKQPQQLQQQQLQQQQLQQQPHLRQQQQPHLRQQQPQQIQNDTKQQKQRLQQQRQHHQQKQQQQKQQQQQQQQQQQHQQQQQQQMRKQQQMQQFLILQQQQQQQQLLMQQQQFQIQQQQQQQFQMQNQQAFQMMRHMVHVSGPPSPSQVSRSPVGGGGGGGGGGGVHNMHRNDRPTHLHAAHNNTTQR